MKALCAKIALIALVLIALLGNSAATRADATSIRAGAAIALDQVCRSPEARLANGPIYSVDLLCSINSLVQSAQLAVSASLRPYSFNWDVKAL